MKILITNDDGVSSSGIIELAKVVQQDPDAEIFVVAPRLEQSGVSQAITFLRPLFPHKLSGTATSDDLGPGFSVDGTPADCAKLGIVELCPFKPDLVISGINGGLNVGVNVCYSGTVGGAFVAATFDVPSVAVSIESAPVMDFEKAAKLAWPIIKQLYSSDWPKRVSANINIPTAALDGASEFHIVPVETNPLGYDFDKGKDPKGRPYYWANNSPDPEKSSFETDSSTVRAGKISVSPVSYDPNARDATEYFQNANSGLRAEA